MTTATTDDRKPISKTLLNLKIEETAQFPIIQFDSIQTQKTRLQRKHRKEGLRWSTRTIEETIEVTRKA